MHMFFWWNYKFDNLLFYGYSNSTIVGFLITCLGMFCIAFLFEMIKVFQVEQQSKKLEMQKRKRTMTPTDESVLIQNEQTSRYRFLLLTDFVLGLNQWLGYLMMLLVMTFNGWFLISIVLGSSLGYFLFGPTFISLTCKNKKLVQESFCDSCYGSTQIENEAVQVTASTSDVIVGESSTVAEIHCAKDE